MINEAKLKKLIKLGAKKPSRNIVVKQNIALKSRRERLEAKGKDSLSSFFAKSQEKRYRLGLPKKLVKGAKEVFKEEYKDKLFNLILEGSRGLKRLARVKKATKSVKAHSRYEDKEGESFGRAFNKRKTNYFLKQLDSNNLNLNKFTRKKLDKEAEDKE